MPVTPCTFPLTVPSNCHSALPAGNDEELGDSISLDTLDDAQDHEEPHGTITNLGENVASYDRSAAPDCYPGNTINGVFTACLKCDKFLAPDGNPKPDAEGCLACPAGLVPTYPFFASNAAKGVWCISIEAAFEHQEWGTSIKCYPRKYDENSDNGIVCYKNGRAVSEIELDGPPSFGGHLSVHVYCNVFKVARCGPVELYTVDGTETTRQSRATAKRVEFHKHCQYGQTGSDRCSTSVLTVNPTAYESWANAKLALYNDTYGNLCLFVVTAE